MSNFIIVCRECANTEDNYVEDRGSFGVVIKCVKCGYEEDIEGDGK